MKKQRQKQINIDAVIKVQNFLKTSKEFIEKGELFSMTMIASSYHIDRMIATLAVRNDYFQKGVVKGEYTISENFDMTATGAKKLIEMVRLSKIESYNAKSVKELAIGGIVLNSNSKFGEDVIPRIESIRKRNNDANEELVKKLNLFSEKEKEFDDKLKIACAIASGCYSPEVSNYSENNNFILDATNDLYEKLKNNN